MRKTVVSAAAAAALATGLLAATGLYAQETGRQEMPGGMMDGNQQGGMMGQDQGMMPMMGMMKQMSEMMQTCNNMMQSMMQDQGPAAVPAQPDNQG